MDKLLAQSGKEFYYVYMKYKYRPIKRGKRKNKTDAYFQFIYDHSTPTPKGFHCQFYFRNKQDLRTRIPAREYGLERLDSVNEEWREVQELHEDYVRLQEFEEKFRTGWRKWILKFI